jgi:hypothetical protein
MDLATYSFAGSGYSCVPAPVSTGCMALRLIGDGTPRKPRAMWLAEALGAVWRHQDRGYVLSPIKAELWHRLYLNGFNATRRPYGASGAARFTHETIPGYMSEAEAVFQLERLERPTLVSLLPCPNFSHQP